MRPVKNVQPNPANPLQEDETAASGGETARRFQDDNRNHQSLSDGYDRNLTLIDYWQIIYRRKFPIAALCMLAALTTLLYCFQLPKSYESTATLLPQLESTDGFGLGALLGTAGVGSAAQNLGVSLPGAPATPTDIFVAILKSRIMADDIIRHFDLMERTDQESMQGARSALQGATRISINKEKVIIITVEDTDPQLAADIANFYVTNLDRLNQTLNVSKARENRKFIGQRLAETQGELVKVENALKEFQTQNRTVAIEAQSKAMIDAAATIQAQILAQEVQLQVMGSYLSPSNPEISRVQASINELRKQLQIMESGKEGKGRVPGDRLHPAITSVPALALQYGRLARDLKVQETLYELLVSQYEQAKLAEARDTPTVQVLDPAIPAEYKSRPRTSQNVVLATMLSLFVGIFWVFIRESFDRRKAALSPRPSLS